MIESETAKADGTPHMKMFKVREVKRYQIEIITFAQIGNILRLASTPEKKFAETRACLECMPQHRTSADLKLRAVPIATFFNLT